MTSSTPPPRKALIVAPTEGRPYSLGRRMTAVFKADCAETDSRYSISEWWLEPDAEGPGTHNHPEDHVFYVLEGTLTLFIAGGWLDAEKGAYAIIPGGTPHDFKNRGNVRCGFISLNIPGGFELNMPRIAKAFENNSTAASPSPSEHGSAPERC